MQALAASHCSFCRGARLQQVQRRQQTVLSTRAVAERAETSASDFRRLTNEEIDQQVQEAKASLFIDFRYQQKRSQKPPKPQLKWNLEKKVAQLLTVKREREIEEGVSKRESRSRQRSNNEVSFGKITGKLELN